MTRSTMRCRAVDRRIGDEDEGFGGRGDAPDFVAGDAARDAGQQTWLGTPMTGSTNRPGLLRGCTSRRSLHPQLVEERIDRAWPYPLPVTCSSGCGPRTYVGRWLLALLMHDPELREQLRSTLNGGKETGWNDDEPAVIEAACELAFRLFFPRITISGRSRLSCQNCAWQLAMIRPWTNSRPRRLSGRHWVRPMWLSVISRLP